MTPIEALVSDMNQALYKGLVPIADMRGLLKLTRACIEAAELKDREAKRERLETKRDQLAHHVQLVRTYRSEGLTVPEIAQRTGLKPRRIQNLIFSHEIPKGPTP